MPTNFLTNRHVLIAGKIFIALAAIYMLTYSGNLAVNDEFMMFNVTASRVRFQDTQYDLALWYIPTTNWDSTQLYPLNDTTIDPLQMIAAMPLYWLAYHVPGVGLVHMVWLFNVLICSTIGVVMYGYASVLGYSERTAVVSAFVLGLLTALWVYSQFFFREPLALALLLLALLFSELWQRAYHDAQTRRGMLWLGMSGIATLLMILTKTALVVLAPGLILFSLPLSSEWQTRPRVRRAAATVIIALLGLVFVIAFTPLIKAIIPDGELRIGHYIIQTNVAQTAIHSYFFSPGGSIWGTSPVLLLALPGAWLLWKQKREWRYTLLTIISLIAVGVSYSLLRSGAWFAGASWPPRFLVPMIPLPLILSLPVIEAFVHQRLPRWITWGISLLGVYSLWWQISGLIFPNGTYSANLPSESNGLADWLPGMNNLRYLRPVVLTQHLFSGGTPINSIWLRTDTIGAPILFLIVLVGAFWLYWRHSVTTRNQFLGIIGLALLLIAGVAWGLRNTYSDPRYMGDNQALQDMLAVLKHESQSDDVVIVNDPTYNDFLLNYGKVDHVRFVTLPRHPGERGSFEQELQVVSDNPGDLMSERSPEQIQALAQQRDHLWLLMETGPFLPWSIRPVEQFMAQNYFPLQEIAITPTVRLLEYATASPLAGNINPAVVDTTLSFGQSIQLEQIKLPLGLNFQSGDPLPFSLFWRTDNRMKNGYTVAVFLADSANQQVLAQGWDSPPAAGFAPTNTWSVDDVNQDNRAIALPDDLPAGDYNLWLRLYHRQDDGSLETLAVTGDHVPDEKGDIAILPVVIHIGS